MKCLDVEPELPAEVDKGNQEGLMISCFIHLTPLVRVCKKLRKLDFTMRKECSPLKAKSKKRRKVLWYFV